VRVEDVTYKTGEDNITRAYMNGKVIFHMPGDWGERDRYICTMAYFAGRWNERQAARASRWAEVDEMVEKYLR